jgi:hypothetical protein
MRAKFGTELSRPLEKFKKTGGDTFEGDGDAPSRTEWRGVIDLLIKASSSSPSCPVAI